MGNAESESQSERSFPLSSFKVPTKSAPQQQNQEESKSRSSSDQRLVKCQLKQFMRNVHSKQDLLYVLEIKGKPAFSYRQTP